MPKDKNFKRLVRERMDKTGERFAAARAQLQAQRVRSSELAEGVTDRDKAVAALSRQVEHLHDATDEALAAGMSLTEIGRVIRLDPELLRAWLLTDSLDEGEAP